MAEDDDCGPLDAYCADDPLALKLARLDDYARGARRRRHADGLEYPADDAEAARLARGLMDDSPKRAEAILDALGGR